VKERVIFSEEPPYLQELPILDNNLYVKHDNNAFLFGGTNLHLIRYSAWAGSSGKATSTDRDGFIEFEMSEQPYIEFSYQEMFYSIEVSARLYSYRLILTELPEPTTELNSTFGENALNNDT
jgi:hypothetical protein